MKGQMDTEMGKIFVDEDVLAKYAGSAAVECFGVVGMNSSGAKQNFLSFFKKDNSIDKGVSIYYKKDKRYNVYIRELWNYTSTRNILFITAYCPGGHHRILCFQRTGDLL